MIIVTGHLTVDAAQRDAYVRDCADAVAKARAAPGCLDFAVSADIVDDARVNVCERWATQAHLDGFRGSGPDDGQLSQIIAFNISEYAIDAPS